MAVDYGLKGQVAVVTGSTSGIGQALADALADAGRQRRAERLRRPGDDRGATARRWPSQDRRPRSATTAPT